MKKLTKTFVASATDKQLMVVSFFTDIEVKNPQIFNVKTKRFKIKKAD